MIIASDEWVDLHKEHLLPETFVEIRLDVTDLDVTDLITVTGKNQASFSNADSIVNINIVPPNEEYALLEYNLWTLDGSKTILSDVETYDPPGFVSKDDASSGLIISLSEIRSSGIPGFTITWSSEYDEYATDFKVEVKNGDTTLGFAEITDNNSAVTMVELDSIDYDKVVITVNKWSVPEHRIRIDAVAFGRAIIFDKNQILSYTHEQTGDPLGSEISKNSIQFSVDNSDGRWDLLNPGSMEKYLYERQPLRVRYGMRTSYGIEWIQAGVFYLTEWRAPSNGLEATFVARDAFEFMLNATYSRASYDGVVVKTSTYPGVSTEGVSVFSTKEGVYNAQGTVTTVLPFGTSVKVYEHSAYYTKENADPIDGVSLYVYRIDQGWIRADCVNIVSDTSMVADMREAINSSTKDIPLTWVYGSNLTTKLSSYSLLDVNVAEFIQKCVNKCGYTMWQKSDGKAHFAAVPRTLSDYVIPMNTSYSHPEVELVKPVSRVEVVAHCTYTSATMNYTYSVGESGDVVVIDNPYVMIRDSYTDNSLGPYDCARGYRDWYKHRGWVSGEFRADPRLELFDVVSVESKYGVISPVMITRIKYTYNGSFIGEYKGKILSTDLVDTGDLDDEVTSIANS